MRLGDDYTAGAERHIDIEPRVLVIGDMNHGYSVIVIMTTPKAEMQFTNVQLMSWDTAINIYCQYDMGTAKGR